MSDGIRRKGRSDLRGVAREWRESGCLGGKWKVIGR